MMSELAVEKDERRTSNVQHRIKKQTTTRQRRASISPPPADPTSNIEVSEDSDHAKAVTPANAGVQSSSDGMISLDSRVRGNDKNGSNTC